MHQEGKCPAAAETLPVQWYGHYGGLALVSVRFQWVAIVEWSAEWPGPGCGRTGSHSLTRIRWIALLSHEIS